MDHSAIVNGPVDFTKVKNQAMKRKLLSGEAIDISEAKRTVDGQYILDGGFIEGKDYCDARTEEWIWSIGKHIESGHIYASKSTKFYQHPGFECLWLR